MKIAHLILAHSEPAQLTRLVSRLSHPDADVYIHLDKKTDIAAFEHLGNEDNVIFIKKRVKVYWGSFNIVQATLNGFSEIIRSGKAYSFVNLLSGQDYPLVSPQFLHNYLSANKGTAFMNYLSFDPDWTEALPRVQEYHFNNLRIKGRYALQAFVNKLLPKRKIPNNLIPVGRSQWFTAPAECIAYILKYWKENTKLRRFIKLTWAPDEFIFQTILYNSPYKENMMNNDLRYIDWSGGGVSPKTLTSTDADALLSSGKFFARKFNMAVDADILDLLDKIADNG